MGCRASAKVTRTTPVANLQSYRVVGVRAAGIPRSYQLTNFLADATVKQLAKRCQFTNVVLANHAGNAKPDLMIDLNIRRMFRGGTSQIIQNPNKAVVDVLVVLSDGIDNDLLGSAWIRGESASVQVSGTMSPEGAAVKAIAERVAKVLAKSGCRGPRVARAPEDDKTKTAASGGGSGGGAGGSDNNSANNTNNGGNNTNNGGNNTDNNGGNNTNNGGNNTDNNGGNNTNNGGNNTDNNGGNNTNNGGNTEGGGGDPNAGAQKAMAETLNDEGKGMFKQANIAGALAKFQEAEKLIPDPRYVYNQCLAYEVLRKYDTATSTCKRVLTMKPSGRLKAKVDRRLGIIASLKKKNS
jgi:hypothetical protein